MTSWLRRLSLNFQKPIKLPGVNKPSPGVFPCGTGPEMAMSLTWPNTLPFSSNDTKHFTNPATPPAFRNFKKEPTITGGADGALDAELKQPKIDPPPPR